MRRRDNFHHPSFRDASVSSLELLPAPHMLFLLTRLLSVAWKADFFQFQSKTPLPLPALKQSTETYVHVVKWKENGTPSEVHPRLSGAHWDLVWAVTAGLCPWQSVRSQIQVVLQSEYFGVDGVQLLSGGRFCLCCPFISVLLIIQPQGRGVQKHRRDGCCIKTKFFNSEFTLVVESFFFQLSCFNFQPPIFNQFVDPVTLSAGISRFRRWMDGWKLVELKIEIENKTRMQLTHKFQLHHNKLCQCFPHVNSPNTSFAG